MSRHITTFQCPNTSNDPHAAEPSQIDFTEFWGGVQRGKCIQVTIGSSYVQMTFDDYVNFVGQVARVGSQVYLQRRKETKSVCNR